MNPTKPSRSFALGFLKRLLAVAVLLALVPLGMFTSCQSKLIYFPRPYPEGVPARWVADTKGKAIEYSTSQGTQRAWLLGNRESPKHLWIVCGGGAHNPAIMNMLALQVAPARVMRAEDAGWNADAIEAQAFAFLAVRSRLGLPLSYPGTTGVERPISGGVFSEPVDA